MSMIQSADWIAFSLKSSHRGRPETSITCEKCGAKSGGTRKPGWHFKRVPSTLGFAGDTIYRCPNKSCRPIIEVRPCRRCANPRAKGSAFCSDACYDTWEREGIFA